MFVITTVSGKQVSQTFGRERAVVGTELPDAVVLMYL